MMSLTYAQQPSTDRWESATPLDFTFRANSDCGGETPFEGHASGPLVNIRSVEMPLNRGLDARGRIGGYCFATH